LGRGISLSTLTLTTLTLFNTNTMTNSTLITSSVNQVILTSEEHGCAYTMDTEGTLLYTPMLQGGGIETEDWSEVEMNEIEAMGEDITREIVNIEQQLITLMKAMGWYYQS